MKSPNAAESHGYHKKLISSMEKHHYTKEEISRVGFLLDELKRKLIVIRQGKDLTKDGEEIIKWYYDKVGGDFEKEKNWLYGKETK